MSTRSLTVFMDDNEEEIVVMYRHSDGYPTGHGADLLEYLGNKTLVNGLTGRLHEVNGMQALAARSITEAVNGMGGPGGIYLYAAGTRGVGEDYVYVLHSPYEGDIYLDVAHVSTEALLYSGLLKDFDPDEAEGKLLA